MIVPGLTDVECTVRCMNIERRSAQCDIFIQPFRFYFFRSFAKKPRASLRISLAFRNSAFSFINLRSFERFSVLWTGKSSKDQRELQYFADLVNESANLFGESHPIPECGLPEL